MKIIKSTFLSIVLLLLFSQIKAQTATSVSTSLNQIITSYMDLKNTLFVGDGTVAQNKAKVLNGQISNVPTKDMSVAERGIWKSYADKLSFDSRHISEMGVIDHQREHFASLSKNLYAVLKAFKVNNDPIYWQYCPMKKASWLSETEAIKNPYYGTAMADCGKTTEILKVAK
jgi:hypothetical protein